MAGQLQAHFLQSSTSYAYTRTAVKEHGAASGTMGHAVVPACHAGSQLGSSDRHTSMPHLMRGTWALVWEAGELPTVKGKQEAAGHLGSSASLTGCLAWEPGSRGLAAQGRRGRSPYSFLSLSQLGPHDTVLCHSSFWAKRGRWQSCPPPAQLARVPRLQGPLLRSAVRKRRFTFSAAPCGASPGRLL